MYFEMWGDSSGMVDETTGLLKYWNKILRRAVKFSKEFFLGCSRFAGLALLNIYFNLLIVNRS